jgi:hypothetical protein
MKQVKKQLYIYVYRSEFLEIIRFNDERYRLLCYDITRSREIYIMDLFKSFMTQTNSVEVADEDPLTGMSWFSGDFSGKDNLDTITRWAKGEIQWNQ